VVNILNFQEVSVGCYLQIPYAIRQEREIPEAEPCNALAWILDGLAHRHPAVPRDGADL
jgi:hypothetical protein